MGNTAIASTTLTFVDVLGDTVAQAKLALAGFTNITWVGETGRPIPVPNPAWYVIEQQPADQVGKEVPSNLAITLMIASHPPA